MKIGAHLKLFCFTTLIIFTSCDYDDDSGQPIDPTPSTFEIIADSEDHTILEQVLVDTGLDEVLNAGIFTVFAPNDEAFNAIDLSGLSNDELSNILLNHVLNGNALSTDFGNGYIKTNAVESYSGDNNFLDLYVNVDGGITLNGLASVIEPDNEAGNGTVHIVDNVITLPTVVTLAASNPNFTNLATGLTQENLLTTLSIGADNSPAPFTIFAPDDNAFDNFISEDNGFDAIEQILNLNNLADILTYHVLPDEGLRSVDFNDGNMLTTVQGETLTISVLEDVFVTDQNDRTTNFTAKDLTATNGVIHIIDNLLLPTN